MLIEFSGSFLANANQDKADKDYKKILPNLKVVNDTRAHFSTTTYCVRFTDKVDTPSWLDIMLTGDFRSEASLWINGDCNRQLAREEAPSVPRVPIFINRTERGDHKDAVVLWLEKRGACNCRKSLNEPSGMSIYCFRRILVLTTFRCFHSRPSSVKIPFLLPLRFLYLFLNLLYSNAKFACYPNLWCIPRKAQPSRTLSCI